MGHEGTVWGYPTALRERAVRLIAESRQHHDSEWAVIRSVVAKWGVGTAETALLSVLVWNRPAAGSAASGAAGSTDGRPGSGGTNGSPQPIPEDSVQRSCGLLVEAQHAAVRHVWI
jgi:hypothetical protein